MEIDITEFVKNDDPSYYSANVAELGPDAARITWRNAMAESAQGALLSTPEQLDALRQWAKGTGAWDASERAAWSDEECNALFIQLVSGDIEGSDGFGRWFYSLAS